MKKTKNKKTKITIKFDPEDRKTYLLGFRKRKQERREKAKNEMIEKMREEKREVKKKRLEMIKDMLDGQDSDESEDECEEPSADNTGAISVCGNSTIQVTNLNVVSKAHLGSNKVEGKSMTKKSSVLKLVSSGLSKKNLKNAIWKTASRNAEKSVKDERNRRKSKKKVMVTEL